MNKKNMISDDRKTVLASIRNALASHSTTPPPHPQTHSDDKFSVKNFRQRLLDSNSTMAEAKSLQEVPSKVAEYCKSQKLGLDIALASGELINLPWQKAGIKTKKQWDDRLSLAVTACRGAIAETGQFLVSNDTPEAWLSLVSPVHVVVIELSSLRNSLDDLGDLLGAQPPSVMTLVHGPSRTGDIEQTIVLGAHGPCQVHAIIVAENAIQDKGNKLPKPNS